MKTKSAVVLAGGKSSRMKYDKQLIRIREKFLVHENIKKLNNIFDKVFIVTNTPEFYSGLEAQTIEDIYPGHGPISGIHAGLSYSESDFVYVLAVDMPTISERYIQLIDDLYQDSYDGLVFKNQNFIEPMHGIYNKRLIKALEQNIFQKKYRISTIVNENNFIVIGEDDLPEGLDKDKLFININTQEELEEYKKEYLN